MNLVEENQGDSQSDISINSTFEIEKENKQNHFIGQIHSAEPYQIDSEFIVYGYRINYSKPKLIFKSLFHCHNELLNVWTHMIGGILAIFLIVYIALAIDDLKGIQEKLMNDINSIFQPLSEQLQSMSQTVTNTGSKAISDYNNEFMKLINEVSNLETEQITNQTYDLLIQKMKQAKDLFSFDYDDKNTTISYANTLMTEFNNIKNNIIESIDSEQFDWIEIYKRNYNDLLDINNDNNNNNITRIKPNHVSRWPLFVFLSTALLCLFGSATFHLFYQMNQVIHKYLMRVDYAGISLLILGSTFPPIYYGFYCQPTLCYTYLSLISVFCISVYIISIFDFIHTNEWRKIKGIMYASLGIISAGPAFHLYFRQSNNDILSDSLPFQNSMHWYLVMGFCYLFGLFLYVSRIPERFAPGKFDIIGHSHQIWHCFVVLGVIFTYMAAIENLYDRKQTFCIQSNN